MNIIQLNNVSKSFEQGGQSFTALSNVSLTITKGEYVALIGKSGSGKSTLLNLITGIDHPTGGHITVADTDIHKFGESSLAAWRGKNIGIIFQFFQLIPTLTIIENILLAMEFVNVIPKDQRQNRAKNLLTQVGILEQANKFPSALSGGEQQRAAIARALANKPEILVADEPTGNLDSATAKSIKAIFTDLVAAGTTVIIVTHEDISGTDFDQIIQLKDGQIQPHNSTVSEMK
ncbi:MAG: ABC transporter ATP-binding protein [Alphaproteobacteria bacterium]|nr:ABC transporter ATP-binding protein [Alphaproteobacteria bacterium]